MSNFEDLSNEVKAGMAGRNSGIPMGFDRLNRYIGIRKRMYTLIGGLTGSGKTSFLDDAYVLNPYDWYISKENTTNIKLRIIYRSMERSRIYKLAKWTARRIFMEHGIIIPVDKLLSWNKDKKLTHDEHDLFLTTKDYIDQLEDVITIIDGPENPIGIAKQLKDHAMANGRVEDLDQYNKVYIPNDENEITLVVLDTMNLLKLTKELTSKKQAIDKMSDELRYARDFYGYSPVAVSQFNREIANIIRIKAGDVEPQLEDFKESGQTQDDADVVLALFDPARYNVADKSGYDLNKLKDDYGAKYFRSLRLIKNSFGEDDVRIGLAFMGQTGIFKELPKRSHITDEDYGSVLNHTFFINTKN